MSRSADGIADGFDFRQALQNAARGVPTVAEVNLASGLETRALGTSTDTTPGSQFVAQVMRYLREMAPMWRLATIRDTDTGVGIIIPKLTADPSYGGTVVAESAAIGTADPTFSSNTLTPYKFASMAYVSNELARDAGFSIVDEVARSTSRELSHDINALFTTGDGSSKPTGILTSAINGGTAQGTAHPADANVTPWVSSGVGFFGPGDMVDLTFAVAAEYRPRSVYQVSSESLNVMQNWRDGSGNRLVIGANDMSSGAAATFNGYEVHVNDDLAAPGSATQSVVFGDVSRYVVNRVLPSVRIDVSRDFRFANDQVAVRTIIEADGELVDAASCAYLVSAAT
jgi:HK97 family phage major capsid protein